MATLYFLDWFLLASSARELLVFMVLLCSIMVSDCLINPLRRLCRSARCLPGSSEG
ncbi:hypothetical protein FA13DRAFT_1732711 [Coprinellus micaceus]|uniref:Copper transporter n=1 Tax=Coprinellus micaceus TaxID=71717 RepID=A0A4Y7TCH2_COPMI|nr:hypothetical protein FA13DRAFT_1732711 [Coprinellus micaceus]